MFQVGPNSYVEFPSSWIKQRESEDASCQTHEIESHNVSSQTVKQKSVQIQVEQDNDDNFTLLDDNSPQLTEFLRRVEPVVVLALERNLHSHAFDDYHAGSGDDSTTITSIHSLTNAELDEQMHVTGLSWNCVGSVIAASYGRFDHEDWCTHRSCVCTWNIDRSSIIADKPDVVIDHSSCIMCLAYHPSQPALLAAADFNGEVIVWDMSQTDDLLVGATGIGDDSHREPVNKIEWIPDSEARKHHLISVGGDGKILVWAVNVKKKQLQLIRGFFVMAESLPLTLKNRSGRADKEVGITCLSYNPDDPETFIVGSESGAVFKCSQRTRGTPAPSMIISSVPLHSPVTFTYAPHHAPVYSVNFSPFHRNVFLSCALDQTLRVYNILQSQPVLVIEPGMGYIFAGQWSPTRPTVAAVVSESGQLLLYDLSHGKTTPAQCVDASTKSTPLYSLQFNKKQPKLLATGDASGHVNVLRLSDDLVSGVYTRDIHTLDTLTSVKLE